MEKIKSLFTKKNIIILVVVLLIAFAISAAYYIFTDRSGAGSAFDWKTGQLVDDGEIKTSMTADWHFTDLTDKAAGNDEFGVWLRDGSDYDLGSRVLKGGEEGDDVSTLQATLNAIADEDVAPETSVYDDATKEAVKLAKKEYGLAENTTVDNEFLRSLYADLTNTDEDNQGGN